MKVEDVQQFDQDKKEEVLTLDPCLQPVDAEQDRFENEDGACDDGSKGV